MEVATEETLTPNITDKQIPRVTAYQSKSQKQNPLLETVLERKS